MKTHDLYFPDLDESQLGRPSLRYRAGLRALIEIAGVNVSATRLFESSLDQFDRMLDVKFDQEPQAGIDAGQYTGSKRQLDLLEAEFIKTEKRRRIELEVQAEVEGLAELSVDKVDAFIATCTCPTMPTSVAACSAPLRWRVRRASSPSTSTS